MEPENDPEDSDYAFAPMGEMLLHKEEQALFDPKRKFHSRRHYALKLDAAKNGNFTRFINHSDEPNVRIEYMRIPKNSLGLAVAPLEVIYFAKKTIHPGEQLLVSYEGDENSYWGAMGIKPYPLFPKTFVLQGKSKIEFRR
ncbi:MAG: SET domain-containing protein-lysine N-methyltransferase [Verrucomicrobia bacterium]|nr:SET domain-containing protein-lysine N-methyltransferase [Verrucomicrobiota bacterium]